MKKNNVIFDIGANDGLDGLGFALFNKNYNVYSFEANPELVLKIEENKKKIEKFFKLKLDNYEIFNKAVSDFDGTSDFNISHYDLCSSLLSYKFVNPMLDSILSRPSETPIPIYTDKIYWI